MYLLEPEKNSKLYSLVMQCPFMGKKKKKNLGEIKKKDNHIIAKGDESIANEHIDNLLIGVDRWML